MRAIKFRAWDNATKKMYYGEWSTTFSDYDIVISLSGKIYNPADHCSDCLSKHLGEDKSNFTLMQFTGLLDKNGKEIYEGDVVKFDEKYEREIFFDDEFARFSTAQELDEDGEYFELGVSKREIIGNIYENPELIKTGGV